MQLRFVHNVSGAPNVNIYINNKLYLANLGYKDISAFKIVPTGTYKYKIVLSDTNDVIDSGKINIKSEKSKKLYTMIIAGALSNLDTIRGYLYVIDNKCPKPGYCMVNVIHAAADTAPVDVYVNQDKVISNLDYPDYKNLSLQIGKDTANPYFVSVQITAAGTKDTLFGPTNLFLINGGIYTLIATGLLNSNFSVLVSHDNKSKCEKLMPNFDVTKYMGKWYQIADIPQFYEQGCARAVAEYTLLQDRVKVVNSCYDENWNLIETITGTAKAETCNPAVLTVSFPGFPNFGPNYLVHFTDYTNYAVIGSYTLNTLYILSRKSKMSKKQYQEIVSYCKSLGYDVSKLKLNFHSLY